VTSISPPVPAPAPRDADTNPSVDTLAHGATVVGDATRFAVWAPNARRVSVRLYDARGGVIGDEPLAAGERGEFAAVVPGVGAGADYAFVLDPSAGSGHAGGDARPDPVSRWQPHGRHAPSPLVDPTTFASTDAAWR
jgi:maltooligosyltrehalose trehalohydrolase